LCKIEVKSLGSPRNSKARGFNKGGTSGTKARKMSHVNNYTIAVIGT